MLHKETVSPELLEILQRLFSFPEMKEFVLVGGTALSLKIGHRRSIDIDLFTSGLFPGDIIPEFLKKNNFAFRQQNIFKGGIFGFINQIKTDFIRHAYPWIHPPEMVESIRFASLPDLAAMKLNAITGSGKRLKDFADVAYLSTYMTLAEMLDSYEEKYPDINGMMAAKSLSYFDDIDFSIKIDFVDKTMNWNKIKNRISEMINNPQKRFESF